MAVRCFEDTEVTTIKVYISGPITGYEEGNRPAFYEAKELLVKRGYEVILPFDGHSIEEEIAALQDSYGEHYWKVIGQDILALSKAEGIIFLSGWEKSKGARLEAYIGLLNGLPMWQLITDEVDVELEELPHPLVAGVCAAQWVPKELLQKVGLAA